MSELTSRQINSLKALLILIVIADHNDFLRKSIPSVFTGLTFHVVGFFVLYLLAMRDKSYSLLSTARKALNLYKSYLIFFCAGVFTLALKSSNIPSPETISIALYTGNFFDIKSVAGAGMLWFIPSFVTFMFITLALARRIKLAYSISVIFMLCTLVFYQQFLEYSRFIPAAIIHTCYIGSIAYLVLFCLKFQNVTIGYWFIVFSLAKSCQIMFSLNQELGSFELNLTPSAGFGGIGIIESVSGVMCIILLVTKIKFDIFNYIGVHSLKFYLIHPFVGVALLLVTKAFLSYQGGFLPLDILLYVLTCVVTWLLVMLTVKLDFVRRIIF